MIYISLVTALKQKTKPNQQTRTWGPSEQYQQSSTEKDDDEAAGAWPRNTQEQRGLGRNGERGVSEASNPVKNVNFHTHY